MKYDLNDPANLQAESKKDLVCYKQLDGQVTICYPDGTKVQMTEQEFLTKFEQIGPATP